MTTFNSISAAATAAINFNNPGPKTWAKALAMQLEVALQSCATSVLYLDGQKGREASVQFKGSIYMVTENLNTGEYSVAIKNI